MAISKVIYATMIVSGEVRSVRNRSGEGKNGPWAIRSLTIEQRSGAQTEVVCWADDGRNEFGIGDPAIGSFFVANVYVNESGREPDLRFHSWAFDELDLIHSNLSNAKAA